MNGNFTLLLTSSGHKWQFNIATMTSSGYKWQFHIANDMLVVMNGNFTLLLTSSGHKWQFHIATDIWWSQMAI